MINRTYFMSVQCYKCDGSGSHSYFYTTAQFKSWKPNHSLVFKDALNEAAKSFSSKGLDENNMQVIAFNRV